MNFIIMFRIKTLAQIGEQYDKIIDYLDQQGRSDSSHKVQLLYDDIIERIFEILDVTDIDSEIFDSLLEEPLIVGEYQYSKVCVGNCVRNCVRQST